MSDASKVVVHVFLEEKEEWQQVVLEGHGLYWQSGDVRRVRAGLLKRAAEFIAALAQTGVEAHMQLAAIPREGGRCELRRALQIRFAVPDAEDVVFEGLQERIGAAADGVYHARNTQVVFAPEADRLATLARIPGEHQL